MLLVEARASTFVTICSDTPLGWACRWGRPEMVKLLLERGADPIEASTEPWATPAAWAKKAGHPEIETLLKAFLVFEVRVYGNALPAGYTTDRPSASGNHSVRALA